MQVRRINRHIMDLEGDRSTGNSGAMAVKEGSSGQCLEINGLRGLEPSNTGMAVAHRRFDDVD